MIGFFLVACGTAPVDAPTSNTPAPASEHRPEPVVAAAPAPAAPAPADPARGAHVEPGHEHAAPHGDHAAEGPFVVPATLPEAVTLLEQQRDQVRGLLDAGKMGDVHPISEQMMKVVVVLPVRARELPAEGKSAVTLAATDLKQVLDALHHAADDGDAAAAKAQLAALDAALTKLAAYKTNM